MNNFNSLMSIVAGFNINAVFRLKHTMAELDPKILKVYLFVCLLVLFLHFFLFLLSSFFNYLIIYLWCHIFIELLTELTII